MEKPKNLYVWPMDMNWGGGECWWERVCRVKGNKERKMVQM